MRRTRRRQARGFTLLEILLVLALILMLATVLAVAVGGAREGARIDSTHILIKQVEGALERYNMHVGRYPSEEDGGLTALRTPPAFEDERAAERWRGPYIEEEPRDPWGNVIHYELTEATEGFTVGKRYRLWSNGPDGQDGTADDIRNWSEEGVY